MTDNHRLYFYFRSVSGVSRLVVKFVKRQLRLAGAPNVYCGNQSAGRILFPLPQRLSRYLVSWLVHRPRNHPQRPPASDLVLPPVDHSQWAADHSTRGAQAPIPWTSERTSCGSFVLATPAVLPGRYRRELRPARSPLCRRPRRCISSRNQKELRLAGSPLHRRHRRWLLAARCYRTIRPRRQQHLRLPAITCDTHCNVYNTLRGKFQYTLSFLRAQIAACYSSITNNGEKIIRRQ